jgi:Zn-dependent protease with chaperone function
MKAFIPSLILLAPAWGARVSLNVQLEANGAISVTASSDEADRALKPVIAAVLGCQGHVRESLNATRFRCTDGLKRDGFALTATLDLSPFGGDQVDVVLDYPSAGFHESTPGGQSQTYASGIWQRFVIPADGAHTPLKIRFGYTPSQVVALYAPMLAAILALILAPALVCRRGLAYLQPSIYVLGASLWLALNWSTGAGKPIEILLAGTGLSEALSVAWGYLVPLLAVTAGATLGRKRGETAAQPATAVFWSYGMIALPMACFMIASPDIVEDGWWRAAPWLSAAAAILFAMYYRLRKRGGKLVQVTSGPLKDRADEIGRRAALRQPGVYISIATDQGPKHVNAFAMLHGRVIITAPLIRLFPKPEVDAIIGHEMSHHRHRSRFQVWTVLLLAAVLFNTVLANLVSGLLPPAVVILALFFGALYFARQREYAADRGAVMLTGDPRSMIRGLARLHRCHERPLETSFWVELLSTHPSTGKRIRAIAAAAGLPSGEVAMLSNPPDVGETYDVPDATYGGSIFNEAWQRANSKRYGVAIMLAVPAVAVAVTLLMERLPVDFGWQLVGGLLLGCVLTKLVVMAVMERGYSRLGRKLTGKLGSSGILVGLAPGDTPRFYSGYRYFDAGLLRMDAGRFCYRSERTMIELGAADLIDVRLVAAAPGSWARRQPLIQFRDPQSGSARSFILHPLVWDITGTRLFRRIEQWRVTHVQTASSPAVVQGFEEVAGEPVSPVAIHVLWRGFRIAGGLALVGGMFTGWPIQPDAPSALYVVAVAASGYAALMLPHMLYRSPRR